MLPKGKILYVEDHDDTRYLVTFIFEQAGYDVTGARNATEGFAEAEKRCFDVIILDYRLPETDGAQLCSQIREFDRQTPIIFFTASAHKSEHGKLLASGAEKVLVKPDHFPVLLTTVERIIESSQLKPQPLVI